jgi:hypothetical protein
MIEDITLKTLIGSLRRGLSLQAACKASGVQFKSLKRSMRSDGDLKERINKAQAEAELILISQMQEHAKTDHRAAAWLLARTNPAKYGKERPEELSDEEVREIW